MLPKLFDLGPIPVHTYGLLLATALLVAISVTARLAQKDGVPRRLTWDLGFVIVLSSVVGAKLLLIITAWDYYLTDLSRLFSLDFLRAGGVYYGGFLGAVAGSYFYCRTQPLMPFRVMADAAAPAIALGQAIGRLGCFAAGCDYGRPSDVPWAVTFTSEYAHRLVGTPLHLPLHPYQLYESGLSLLFFVALLAAHGRRRFQGQVFALYLIGYGLIRFWLEFYRGDADRGFVFGEALSTSQFISLLIIPAGLILYWRGSRTPRKPVRWQK